MSEAFKPYEKGLMTFREELEDQPKALDTFLTYEHLLRANMRQAREDGDTAKLSAKRGRVVEALNQLAQETVGTTFNELSGLRSGRPVLTTCVAQLPPSVMVFFNLLLAIALAILMRISVSPVLPCLQPWATAASLALILAVLLHLAWRYWNPVIKAAAGTVSLGVISAPIKFFASVADGLHPYPPRLSCRALWLLLVGSLILAFLVWLRPLPLLTVPEPVPVIEGFSVGRSDQSLAPYAAGDVVEIPASTQVIVEA